jgi:hypothetical protein
VFSKKEVFPVEVERAPSGSRCILSGARLETFPEVLEENKKPRFKYHICCPEPQMS